MNTDSQDATLEKPEHVSPRNGTERRLLDIWEAAFKHDSISVTDDFFALGGDSLLAVSIFAEIEKSFECKLPLATLLEQSTVEQLAELVGDDTT